VWQLLVFLVAIFIIYSKFRTKEMSCNECGYVGDIRKIHRGNFLIEIILWCCFIVPGLIYTIWRSSNRFYQCPNCKSERVIPNETSSTSGTVDFRRLNLAHSASEKNCPQCAELVKSAALICRFCGHNFE
jgi:RNA polymerase subunit RPABC4/transcription elongation factor Spt4